MDKLELSYIAGRAVKWHIHTGKNSLAVHHIVECRVTIKPKDLFSTNLSRKVKMYLQQYLYINIHSIAAVFKNRGKIQLPINC